MMDHLKQWWKQYCGGGLLAMILAAMMTVQHNTPVTNSPVLVWTNNTTAIVKEAYTSDAGDYLVVIQPGFATDGASEPRVTWTALGLTPFSGASLRASVTHDALYAGELVSRGEADLVFRDILYKEQCESNKVVVMYEAVSRAGGFVWAMHTKESVAQARKFVSLIFK